MRYIGITGTNGKTTTALLTAQLLEQTGEVVGIIGTLGAGRLGNLESTGFTTPDAKLQEGIMPKIEAMNCTTVVMEVSSHGLVQNRVAHIPFEVAAFTNLTHDHLDYHKTMEEYARAKSLLFEFQSLKTAVLNADDPAAEGMLTNCIAPEIIGISKEQVSFKPLPIGFELTLGNRIHYLPLLGEFNIQNALIALAIAESVYPSWNFDLSELDAPCGRMELFPLKDGATAVIDYAHTPDALEKSLQACRQHCPGKLWVIFGCGGDRDRLKRPVMAKIAEELADHVVLTEDNARFENPEQIYADIQAGFEKEHRLIPNRGEAIQYACEQAKEGDFILLAGKGHERYMDVEGERVAFDERNFLRIRMP